MITKKDLMNSLYELHKAFNSFKLSTMNNIVYLKRQVKELQHYNEGLTLSSFQDMICKLRESVGENEEVYLYRLHGGTYIYKNNKIYGYGMLPLEEEDYTSNDWYIKEDK